MDDNPSVSHTFPFPSKSIWQHARGVLRRPFQFSVIWVGIFATLWTIADALSLSTEGSLATAGHLALGSLILAVLGQIQRYIEEVPPGFETASRRAQRLVQLQPKGWQIRLVQTLIAERIGPLEHQLSQIENSREFILKVEFRDPLEFSLWLNSRAPAVEQMLMVAVKLILQDLRDAASGGEGRKPDAQKIKLAIDSIERLYAEMISFERSVHERRFPDRLKRLERSLTEWTQPIRKLVADQLLWFEDMIEHQKRGEESLAYHAELIPHENVDLFCEELEALTPDLYEILSRS